MRWGEGGPKDTSGSKFPELYIPDYGVSLGTQTSRAKSPSQESGRESGTRRRASSPHGPRVRRYPRDTCPRPSPPSAGLRRPRPPAPSSRTARPLSGGAQGPQRAPCRRCTVALPGSRPHLPGDRGHRPLGRPPPLPRPAAPAPLVRTCVWSLAGLGRGRAGLGAGAGSGWARRARAAAAPDSGQGSNSVTEQKAKGPDSQATPLAPSKPRPRRETPTR